MSVLLIDNYRNAIFDLEPEGVPNLLLFDYCGAGRDAGGRRWWRSCFASRYSRPSSTALGKSCVRKNGSRESGTNDGGDQSELHWVAPAFGTDTTMIVSGSVWSQRSAVVMAHRIRTLYRLRCDPPSSRTASQGDRCFDCN
jgi:hypothetical protein